MHLTSPTVLKKGRGGAKVGAGECVHEMWVRKGQGTKGREGHEEAWWAH
jgi:hypothetical protein